MTSRELTSGFDFWSRGHLRMAVLHLPVKFGADIFIQCGVIDIFRKLKMAVAAILDLLGEPWDHPRRHTRGAYYLLKFRHDRISSFQVIRVWSFCRSGLKVLFTPPKLSFWGVLPPKFRGTSFRPPKGTSLRDFTSNELLRVKIHQPVWPVRDLRKKRYK